MWKAAIAAAVSVVALSVQAQSYPDRPIRIVAPAAGGGADVAVRLLSQPLSSGLGQPLIIDNRGGNVVTTVSPVIKAAADGYTLLFYGSGLLLYPFMNPGSFDIFRDFTPITLVDSSPSILVVHPSLPVNSVRELVAMAKSKPGALNFAGGTAGAAPTMAALLFNAMAGVDITRINYKGTGQAINDVVAGRVQLMFASSAGAPFVRSGKLRILAVTSAKPSSLYPNVPTVASAGYPGYEVDSYHAFFGPAGLPATVVNRIHTETLRALAQPEVKAKLFASGIEIAGVSPQEFAAQLKREAAIWGKIIKDADIRDE